MRIAVAIVMLIVLVLSVTPCCTFDGCQQDHEPTSATQEEKGMCSPFFSCTTCPGFTSTASSPDFIPEKPTYHAKPFSRYTNGFTSCYIGKFWQPPKIA